MTTCSCRVEQEVILKNGLIWLSPLAQLCCQVAISLLPLPLAQL